MSILLIHHIEQHWEEELNKSGTSTHYECVKILRFLKKMKSIKEVIFTKSANKNVEFEYQDIIKYCYSKNINVLIKKYKYGWLKNNTHQDCDLNIKWCYATRFYYDERDILIIPEWLKSRANKQFVLTGCFDHACINDMRDILKSQNIKYYEIKDLVVK